MNDPVEIMTTALASFSGAEAIRIKGDLDLAGLLVQPHKRGERFGINIGWPKSLDDFKWRVDRVKELGVASVRMNYPTTHFSNKPGEFVPDKNMPYTAMTAYAKDAGLHILAQVSFWPSYSQNPSVFGEIAGQIVATFHPDAIEVFNEPNGGGWNWKGNALTPNPVTYWDLVRATAFNVDRPVPIIAGALSVPTTPDGTLAYLDQMLAIDEVELWNAISCHPYTANRAPMTPKSWNQFYRLPEYYERSKSPLWLTEIGYHNAGEGKDSDLSLAQVSIRWEELIFALDWYVKQGIVDRTYIYELQDSGTDPKKRQHNYGLIDTTGKKKPVFDVVAAAMGETVDG